MNINNVNQAGRMTGQENRTGLSGAMKKAAEWLAYKLLSVVKTAPPPTNRADATENLAQVQEQSATQAAENGPPPFDAKSWLKQQCVSLENALQNPDSDAGDGLKGLYAAAQSFKQEIIANGNDLRAHLPAELQNDFQANLQVIQQHFNGTAGNSISHAEMKFLQSYLGFMKSCLTGSDAELGGKLQEVQSLLDKAITKSEATIADKQDELQGLQRELDADQTRFANLESNIQHLENTSNRTEGQEAELNTNRQERDALNVQIPAKAANAISLSNRINDLRRAPALIDTISLKQQVDTARDASVQAENSWQDAAVNTNTPEAEIPRLEQEATKAREHFDQKTAELAEGERLNATLKTEGAKQLRAGTLSVIDSAQVARAVTLGLGKTDEMREPRTIFNASVEQVENQFDTVSTFAVQCKNPHREWRAATLEFRNELARLKENPSHQVELSEKTLTYIRNFMPNAPKASDFRLTQGGESTCVYEQAYKLITTQNAAQPQQAGGPRPAGPELTAVIEESDNCNKKLALVMIGSWCAQQTMVKSNDTTNVYNDTSHTLDAAADLLAGNLLVGQSSIAPTTAGNATKESIDTFVERSGLKAVQQQLNALPPDTPAETHQNIFLNALALNTSESLDNAKFSPQQLLKMAETDHTFKNDRAGHVLLGGGDDRQTPFRDAMIGASAVINPQHEAGQEVAHVGARINAVKSDLSEIDWERVKQKLGLGSENGGKAIDDKLLDQLALAAIAQNDLAMNPDHVHRGSMAEKIDRFINHPTTETLKNHSLHGYDKLSRLLIQVATEIRGDVNRAIDATSNKLESSEPVQAKQIQQLVKQIIVTTDAKSSLNENFKLAELVTSSENLIAKDTPENREAFKVALGNTKEAWKSVTGENEVPKAEAWKTKDNRSLAYQVLKGNPVKSLPFVNRIPFFASLSYSVADLAKKVLAASVYAAAGGVLVGVGVAAAATAVIVGVPTAFALQGLKAVSR